jgi:hypothetical protein
LLLALLRLLPRIKILTIVFVLALLVGSSFFSAFAQSDSSQVISNSLSKHWDPHCGFRTELNPLDQDYWNCFYDDAGKILVSSVLSGDSTDARRAFNLINSSFSNGYYLPELNTIASRAVDTIQYAGKAPLTSNALVELENNASLKPYYEQLGFGTNFTGPSDLGYLGAYRIVLGSTGYYPTANKTIINRKSNTMTEESNFTLPGGNKYIVSVSATIRSGEPYINESLLLEPLNAQLPAQARVDLQVFSSAGQFASASLYDSNGNFQGNLKYNSSSPATLQDGFIISYDRDFNVMGEDEVALTFNATRYGSTIEGYENWYQNKAYGALSWTGLSLGVSSDPVGKVTRVLSGFVYPIGDGDYRMVNQTAKFIATNHSLNKAVAPPVSFGFIAYGLALYAESHPAERSTALGYWNYYYSIYNNSNYSTVYARAISVFGLAGLVLYPKSNNNATVDAFVRRFANDTIGVNSYIEENGWAAAALCTLANNTGNKSDATLCSNLQNSFVLNSKDYLLVKGSDQLPTATFQFGETASGLLISGLKFNNQYVLAAMSAVFQAINGSGVLNMQPTDLGNTEAIPASILSRHLFNGSMMSTTGYTIDALHNANLTSINFFSNKTLVIKLDVNHSGGSLTVSNKYKSFNYKLEPGNEPITIVYTNTSQPTCSPLPLVLNQPSTCKATVTSSSKLVVPTGNITFAASFGTLSSESCSTSGVNQLTCSIIYTPTKSGNVTLTAIYLGDNATRFSSNQNSLHVTG